MAGPYLNCDVVLLYGSQNLRAQTGFSVVFPVARPNLLTVGADIADAWKDSIRKRTSVSWELEGVRCSALGDSQTFIDPEPGDENSLGATSGVCFLVSKIPFQGAPGRMYLPGVTETAVLASGRFASNVVSNVQAELDKFLEELEDRQIQMNIRRPDTSIEPIRKLVLKPYVGRQDRRLVRSRR